MNPLLANILIILGIFVGVFLLLDFFRKYNQSKNLEKISYTTLEIRVFKDNEVGPLAAEQVFATLHNIYKKHSFLSKLFGAIPPKISLEISNINRSIRFYINFPSKFKNIVSNQIYASYPQVEINEVEDPLKSYKYGSSIELGLNNLDMYPIKRYNQFIDKISGDLVDPISGVTSAINSVNNDDEAITYQIVISPLHENYRQRLISALSKIEKGMPQRLQRLFVKLYASESFIARLLSLPITIFSFSKKTSEEGEQEPSDNAVAKSSHDRETAVMAAKDKLQKLLFKANVRLSILGKTNPPLNGGARLKEISSSLNQYNIPYSNGFTIKKASSGAICLKRVLNRKVTDPNYLNIEELATLYHMPDQKVDTPNIYWVKSRKLEPPSNLPIQEQEITVLGKTNFRGYVQKFGIKEDDRRRHTYIIGKTGMGKSTLLENMIFSDIQNGKGVGVIDPHGDLAEAVLNFVPSNRSNDIIIFDPSDTEFPVAFNMLECNDPNLKTIVASGLIGVFKKLYGHSWGPRLEHILRNTILTLLAYPNTNSILGIPRILQDSKFRRKILKKIDDPILTAFWENEFMAMQPKQMTEAISPILNKVGQFLSSPLIRNILGQIKSTLDIRFAMDTGKIIIVNLSKGKIGEDNSALLGSMLITKFQIDAMTRANQPVEERKDFYLYVDEFQNFATESFATILSEARKYKLNLTMANQYIAQMPDEVKDAVFGNVGTILSYQVGFDDAEYLSSQFSEEVSSGDLTSLNKYTAYLKLLIEGIPSKTFSLDTLPPPDFKQEDNRREILTNLSRERYAKPKDSVEDKIKRWSSS